MLQNAGNSDEFAISQARAKAYQRIIKKPLKGKFRVFLINCMRMNLKAYRII